MALKAVIFDLFGVLTCTTSPENRIIKEFKLDPKIHPALQRAVCGQKFASWKKYLDKVIEAAGIENSQSNRVVVRGFVDSEVERGLKNVFPKARKVLRGLKVKGYVLGFVSNAYPGCRRILEENELLSFFKKEAVIFSYEVGMTKQDPEIFRACLRRLGVPAEKAVMVGDSLKSDIMMSRVATKGKMRGILISARPSAEAKKAGCIVVSSLAKVPKAVNDLSKARLQKKRRRTVRRRNKRRIRRRV